MGPAKVCIRPEISGLISNFVTHLSTTFSNLKLAIFRANGDFSQGSLSIFGNPNAKAFGWRGCLSSSWGGSPDERVPQPPKMRKTLGVKKSTLSEKISTGSNNPSLLREQTSAPPK